MKVEYLGELKTKIKNIFGRLSGAQMGSFRQSTLILKNLMQVNL
jgi:hypothetical protein